MNDVQATASVFDDPTIPIVDESVTQQMGRGALAAKIESTARRSSWPPRTSRAS
jgi:hypothetical protein